MSNQMTRYHFKIRPYQTQIANKATIILNEYKLVYLALETRTGKTITSFEIVKKMGFKSLLFVTKKKAITSVLSDYNLYSDCFNCKVVNYESAHKIDASFDIVILDESHCLAAYPKASARQKVIKEICKGLPIIYLSATPTPESFSQIYHQLQVSSFSPFIEYKNFYGFAQKFVNIVKRKINGFDISDYSDAIIERIEPFIKPIILNLSQRDAGFDVAIKEDFIHVALTPQQRAALQIIKRDKVLKTQSGDIILADTPVKLMSKVHQICSGSCIDENGNYHLISNVKAVAIHDKFKGKKIAIFYKFKGEFELLKSVFKNWTDNPVTFQQFSDLVYLGQFASSREGVRLDTADAIVFYNIDFSFLSYEQAKNRIISKERASEAILYWCFSVGGIEHKIYETVKNKQNFTTYHFKRLC